MRSRYKALVGVLLASLVLFVLPALSVAVVTLVEGSFRAADMGSYVQIQWETATEMDTAGFYVCRSTSSSGPFDENSRIPVFYRGVLDPDDPYFIPSADTGGSTGARYVVSDTNVIAGTTYYYKLEDISTGGQSGFNGSVNVTFGTLLEGTPTSTPSATATSQAATPTSTGEPNAPTARPLPTAAFPATSTSTPVPGTSTTTPAPGTPSATPMPVTPTSTATPVPSAPSATPMPATPTSTATPVPSAPSATPLPGGVPAVTLLRTVSPTPVLPGTASPRTSTPVSTVEPGSVPAGTATAPPAVRPGAAVPTAGPDNLLSVTARATRQAGAVLIATLAPSGSELTALAPQPVSTPVPPSPSPGGCWPAVSLSVLVLVLAVQVNPSAVPLLRLTRKQMAENSRRRVLGSWLWRRH